MNRIYSPGFFSTTLTISASKVILGRQKRDYGVSIEFPAQYPTEQETSGIDDTSVTDITMESLYGQSDYCLQKRKSLEAVSRSLIHIVLNSWARSHTSHFVARQRKQIKQKSAI